MSRLGRSIKRTVQLDFDGATQLLGKEKMFATLRQREIGLVLAQLDTMPAIGPLETGEAHTRDSILFGSKETFESSTQPIREHLNSGGRNMLPTSSLKGNIQLILGGERPISLILLLHRGQHLIIDMARLDETTHEQVLLLFIRIDPILKCSHVFYFIETQ